MQQPDVDVNAAVVEVLGRRARKARFVPEVVSVLRRTASVGPEQVEQALADLESAGRVIVRDHFCADPHMQGSDLRIVGLVEAGPQGEDPQSRAIADIEATWGQWLSEYLANHRCS